MKPSKAQQRRQARAERLVRGWQGGESLGEIARAIGATENAVKCQAYALRRIGVPLVKRNKWGQPLDVGALIALASQGAPLASEVPSEYLDRPAEQKPAARVKRCGCGAVLLPREVSAHVCEVRR